MPARPFDVVRMLEDAIAEYCGAPLAVACTSCTVAIQLALMWCLRDRPLDGPRPSVNMPRFSYIGVPQSIIWAGGWPTFRDENWEPQGEYQLTPYPVWDSARLTTSGMFRPGQIQCLSLHWAKPLGVGQGGVLLLDDGGAYDWLKRARFDGRREGVSPQEDTFDMLATHSYMSPATAAEGLTRLALLPKHNDPLPWDAYRDLSTIPLFR